MRYRVIVVDVDGKHHGCVDGEEHLGQWLWRTVKALREKARDGGYCFDIRINYLEVEK